MTRPHENTTSGMTRRSFLAAGSATIVASQLLHSPWVWGAESGPLHVATNFYPWLTFYRRENRDFNADLDASLGEVAAAGLNGFESGLNSPEDVDRLSPFLKKHGLELRSFYVNAVMHEPEAAEKSIAQVLTVAEKAHNVMATRIVVINPSPLSWNREAPNPGKNDAQLETQAKALDQLGAALRERGMQLAYHNHDMELRNAAREFHHMMLATKPENMGLCLDAHWIYRGSGNSQVALFDVVKLYGSRVCELHLRQSKDGIWTEAFGEGDIDYPRLARELAALGVRPHLVLEQAVEQGSPNTMNAVEAHRRGVEYVRKLFS